MIDLGWRRHSADAHPPDADLLAHLTAPSDDVAVETVVRHLGGCDACGARLDELRGLLDGVALQHDAAFDAAYPATHLAQQRAAILGRLERADAGRIHARVLRFPAATGSMIDRGRAAGGWLGAAAAAGLVVGIGIGQVLHWHPPETPEAPAPAQVASLAERPATHYPAPEPISTENDPDVEALMDQVESLLSGPQVWELRTLDAITPRTREVALSPW